MNKVTAIVFIIAMILLSPLLVISGLNTISEQASLGFYIPHNFWTYISTYAVLIPFKGS